MTKKKPTMSKEEAVELYDDLQRTMNQLIKNTAGMDKKKGSQPTTKMSRPVLPSRALDKSDQSVSRPTDPIDFGSDVPGHRTPGIGNIFSSGRGVVFVIATLVAVRVIISIADHAGVANIKLQDAKAVVVAPDVAQALTPMLPTSRAERDLLLDLDRRRVDLEKRATRLDERADELGKQEKAIAVKLAELRNLTATLREARLQNSKNEAAQTDQLSKVYGAMNPPEAAALIEQLDIQIALPLLKRMPEKRMAQILSLMKAERAVLVTRMLSGSVE